MPLHLTDFRPLDVRETNPFGGVLSDAIAKRLAQAHAEKAEVESRYAERKTIADILHQEQENQFYPRSKLADIIGQENINKYYGKQAESGLQTSALARTKTQLEIDKAIADQQQERNFSKLLRDSMQQQQGAPQEGAPERQPMAQPYAQQTPQPYAQPMAQPGGLTQENLNPYANAAGTTNRNATLPGTQNLNVENPSFTAQRPEMPESGNISGSKEQVLSPGNPQFYNIDDAYEKHPEARAFLEKKGFKKVEKMQVDKSGNVRLFTKSPSGRVTVRNTGAPQAKDIMNGNIPLTKPVLNKLVNQLRGSIAVKPYIKKLLDLGDIQFDKSHKPIGTGKKNGLPWTYSLNANAEATYRSIVASALEKYISASGLQQSDISTKKMEEVLYRAPKETANHYVNRLYDQLQDMERDDKINEKLIREGIKIYGGDFEEKSSKNNSGNEDFSDLDKYDEGD